MTGPLEKLRPGRRWFESANRRIADFAGERGADDAAAPQSIARIILDTAAAWSSIRAAEGDVEDLGSAEAVMSFAAQRGVAARFETGKAASLQASDFPLATLTHSGEARLLTGRDGAQFSALASGSAYEIDLATLQAEETGTIVLLRPSDRSAFGEADVADSATAAATDPVREALNYVIQRQRPLLVKLLLAAAFSNLMLLAVPIYTSVVFDRVIPHSAWETMWAISIGVGLALVADFAVRWARLKLQDAIATTASATLQAATFRRLVEVRMSEAPRSASSVMMRLREVEGLTQLAPQFIAGVVVDAPFLVLVFALIWVNGGPVVFAPVVGLVMLAALHHFADLASHAAHIRSSKLSQVQTKHLFETAESLETVKAARSERKALSRFDQFYDEYAYSAHLARAWSGLAAYANMTVGQMMIVLVMVIGVFQVSQGGMTVGGLSACILLVGRIISPIGQLITVINRMRLSRSTLKSLSQDTSGQTEAGGDASGAAIPPRIATLRLSEACYRYPEQAGAQLDKVSLTIQPGEKVAVIGRSGSGKSTLLKMLVRFIEPQEGAVLFGDVDARQYAPSDLRKSIGYMGQSPGLFDDTLLANLTLGLDSVDPQRLDAVARLTGVAEFGARHPQGYGMNLGPRGERLSGGEQQSVALARVLLGEHGVLALDEPTSAMDTTLEMRVVRDLKAYVGERTLIVSTHRAPVLALVDRVIWLDHGRVVADGPKAEVLKLMSGAAA